METISSAQHQINEILNSIQHFINESSEDAIYKAPIIDWHHPNSYKQSAIVGLKKFLLAVENERDYIDSLAESEVPPLEIASNIPYYQAVWEQVKYAQWPIISIGQHFECQTQNDEQNRKRKVQQIKVDVVEDAGKVWVKVNTIKESRLMAEFREQDSYLNSDYDDDDDDEIHTEDDIHNAGPSSPQLINSLITQAKSLIKASHLYPRFEGCPPPRIKYVLNRLEEHPEGEYEDERVHQTFQTIRSMGIDLILASDQRIIPKRTKRPDIHPTNNILLDLSVLVALCCDSTHLHLPTTPQELEERFRSLKLTTDGEVVLADHIPVTKDLRDQLEWEMKHPLIQEMLDRLSSIRGNDGGKKVEFWVTEEVRNRLPGIVEIIGGEDEQRRAKILFSSSENTKEDFWQGSRWKDIIQSSKEGSILRDMKINILPPEYTGENFNVDDVHTSFQKGFVGVVKKMLDIVDVQERKKHEIQQKKNFNGNKNKDQNKDKKRRSKNPNNPPSKGISLESKLPSIHTLRTFLVGFQKGWTVLTNNRGSVGKVLREMRIDEGLGYCSPSASLDNSVSTTNENVEWQEQEQEQQDGEDSDKVDIWVVNPSSLSEWRRKEVKMRNAKLREYLSKPDNQQSYKDWLKDQEGLGLDGNCEEEGKRWKRAQNKGGDLAEE
ncbi:hypothetical protein I204_00552 [Kwoniella mangroviensis CBS 8886]|nr:hypothetical protein I204_00552 [Kwoniella mangroviensis CBS 8886]